MLPKKNRKSRNRLDASQTRHASRASLDTWLIRGSHIAQVGLFALTLWALFYTVIPLYKTAALEEQIARREAELKDMEQNLARTVTALKDATEKAYHRSRADILWNLDFQAGPRCSGLLRPVEQLASFGGNSREEPVLLDNVGACLKGVLDKLEPESVLRHADLLALHATVDQTIVTLEERRSDAQAAITQMETKSVEELYTFAPKGPFVRRMDEWFATVGQAYPEIGKRATQDEHTYAVRHAQAKIVRDFENQVRVEIRKLRNVVWPAMPN